MDGRLDAALNEWGKMLLDLAAHPNLRDSDPIPYPAGVANQYLSKKTMPTLAKHFLFEDEKKLFKAPRDLDSQELGLLLETRENAESDLKIDSLKILREECGIRRFSSQGLTQEIDAEVFRRVWKALQKDKRPETELFRLLQARLRESSLSGLKKKLEKEIRIQGELRLQTILDVQPSDDIRNLFQTKTISKAIDEVLREAYVACEMFAEALGNYLGDFIVLLYGLYKNDTDKLSTVILGGGVLSGKTRELVIAQAQKRTDMYNIWLAEEDEKWNPKKYRNRKEPHNIKITIKYPGTDSQGNKPDFGTLGAAAYAAGEFLFNLKKEGLNRIKKNLMRLETGQSIRVLEGSAVFRALSDEIILKEFALEEQDVIDYLDKHGAEHNYLSAGTDAEGAKVYTRWIRE